MLINVLSYDVVLHSISDANSTVVCAYKGDIAQGDFILCDEFCGVIKQVAVTGRTMTLTCSGMDRTFDRLLYFPPDTDTHELTTEAFIAQGLLRHYKMCDEMYAYPYMTVRIAASDTPFFLPNLSDKSMYTLSDYIRSARRHGINVKYDLAEQRLHVT